MDGMAETDGVFPAGKLDPFAAREDMTDRECAKILGSLISGLTLMTPDIATVRRAVEWWASSISEPAWRQMEAHAQQAKELVARLIREAQEREQANQRRM